jgi:hypothetical protein
MSSEDHSSPKPAVEKQEEQGSDSPAVGIRERVKHVTWAWFLSTMSTGGLSIALAETPHKFRGMRCYVSRRSRLTYLQDSTQSVSSSFSLTSAFSQSCVSACLLALCSTFSISKSRSLTQRNPSFLDHSSSASASLLVASKAMPSHMGPLTHGSSPLSTSYTGYTPPFRSSTHSSNTTS